MRYPMSRNKSFAEREITHTIRVPRVSGPCEKTHKFLSQGTESS